MTSRLKSLTEAQSKLFDVHVNRKIFKAPDPLIAHLKDVRQKLSPKVGMTVTGLKESLKYVRFYRYKMVDQLPLLKHMVKYYQDTERQIQSLDVVIAIYKEILAIPYRQPKTVFSKPDACPICLESLADQVNPLSCGHWTHEKCMKQWDQYTSENTCVVCKSTKIQHTD